MMMTAALKAPFPWFGGKSRAAPLVWSRFGALPNYVEPFYGSGAVLLGRPTPPSNETVNDLDCFVSNFWRAVQRDPESVCQHADWPVNEADLFARHNWLCAQHPFREKIRWWVWGLCQWIGGEWCSKPEWEGRGHAGRASRGINKRPRLARGGRGVAQKPCFTDGNRGICKNTNIFDWLTCLSERLRYVRVCCGDWKRVLTPSVTFKIGQTGVLLDPPYSADSGRDMRCYAQEDGAVAHAVREWAIANGENPQFRIALCGYEGEHAMPPEWDCVYWKANGGYAVAAKGQSKSKDNCRRERIWFSPHCLKPDLFSGIDHA